MKTWEFNGRQILSQSHRDNFNASGLGVIDSSDNLLVTCRNDYALITDNPFVYVKGAVQGLSRT